MPQTDEGRRSLRERIVSKTPSTIDALLTFDAPMLKQLYRSARVPRLLDVQGPLRSRMLVTPVVGGVWADGLRKLSRSSRFPWQGKTFWPESELRGAGVNTVLGDRLRMVRFDSFIGSSRAGDFDAIQLDYDRPSNPAWARRFRDELRELAPGLYLGQTYWLRDEGAKLLFYFALTR